MMTSDEMTLDKAQDAFRGSPNLATAQSYLNTAIDYWQDEMIGDDTFGAAKQELRAWCLLTGSSLLDPRTQHHWHT